MGEYIVQHDTMAGIADAIHEKTGTTGTMTAAEMPGLIAGIKTGSGGFPNGTQWTQPNITSEYFYSVTNANGIWISGSDTAGLYYSTDGMTWIQSNIASGDYGSVANANGIWVAAGTGICYSIT